MQSFLLPPSPRDWLAKEHPVYFMLDVVEELDLAEFERKIASKDSREQRPYHPRMMLAVLLYAYSQGVYSSRRIARACHNDVAFRVICGGAQPHFTVLNEFRRLHQEAFTSVFLAALKLCREAGLVKLGHVALDGTKVQGNASKRKAMSYRRMAAEETRLKQEIEAMMEAATAADGREDQQYGAGVDPEDLPRELQFRRARLEKIRAAKSRLEAEAKQERARQLRKVATSYDEHSARHEHSGRMAKQLKAKATTARDKAQHLSREGEGDDEDDEPGDRLPRHRIAVGVDGTPADKAQSNFTDPESRIMKGGSGSFIQGYNAKAVVDHAHQVIVAADVTNQPPDNGNYMPMLTQTTRNMGQAPEVMSADTGYWEPNAPKRAREGFGTQALIAVGAQRCAAPQPDESTSTPRQQMQQQLLEPEGAALYRLRKAIVEPVFGHIKECRGLRRFSRRGLQPARSEWLLIAAVHNLLKLRSCKIAAEPA